jgi:TetR/AcrR family transcriptional repressor of nem operon
MPRTKQYDREKVIATAMDLFWDRGYHATGVADLEAAMGINKFSLYAAFGSKRGLLLQALDHYARTWQAATFARLDPREPAESILGVFEFASRLPERIGHNGCFLLSIGQEFNHADPEILSRVEALYANLELRFQACLRALPRRAPLAKRDTTAAAAFLRTLLEGVLARSRHGGGTTGADPLEVLRPLLGLSEKGS